MEKLYSTHLERSWVTYVICLLSVIFHFNVPLWVGVIIVAFAGIIEILIKNAVIKKHGIVNARKYGIYK